MSLATRSLFNFDGMSKLGNQLDADDRRYVLSAFVHRFTGDHRPAWVNNPRPNGQSYQMQFASDADWLANTRFVILPSTGRVDRRVSECYSQPTWPNDK